MLRLPIGAVFPRRGGRDAPSAKGPVVLRQVRGHHPESLVERLGVEAAWIVPALPGEALAELLRLPTQVGLLRLDDLVRAAAQKLCVPLGHAEFPGRHRVAELALAF